MILERVGQGGMGTVYAAYDPELDRRVALKLLRQPSDALRVRLRREAQAMARLTHPNIVAVHDVGDTEAGVFLAMEYIAGATLRAWLAEPRELDAILAAFVDAGRGLAAAHRAGIIHRDFKPDNVLVDRDGHVRVTDFGLARLDANELAHAAPEDAAADPYATSPHTLLGTPAYMAPEQLIGSDVDARADQFAFCAALWEALYGAPAFEMGGGRAAAIARGPRVPDKSTHRVPPWLQQLLVRGLAVVPAARFADMGELLGQLDRGHASGLRRAVIAAAVIGAIGIPVAAWQLGGTDTEPPCSTAGDELARVWPHDTVAVLAAFGRVPAAARLGTTVTERLGQWRLDWMGEHQAACRATRIAGVQSEHVLDQRMACLRRVAADARAASTRIAAGDPVTLSHATELVDGLNPPATCGDLDQIARAIPYPADPAQRAYIARLEDVASELNADKWTTDHPTLRARADALNAQALATSFVPLIARAHMMRGEICSVGRDPWCATESYRLAASAAIAASLDYLAITATARLARNLTSLERTDEAAAWLDTASAIARRVPEEPIFAIDLLSARADIALERGDFPNAISAQAQAVRLADEGSTSAIVRATAHESLGIYLAEAGDYPKAIAAVERAVAIHRTASTSAPTLAAMISTLATIHLRAGQLDTSCSLGHEALAAYEKWYGRDHIVTTEAMSSLAHCLMFSGDVDGAFTLFERARGIVERSTRPAGPGAAEAVSNMATAYASVGRYTEAIATAQRAIAMFEGMLGTEHVRLVIALEVLGYALRHANRLDEAERVLRRAVTLADRGHGKGHPATANSRTELALVALARKDTATAVRMLEESVAIADSRRGLNPVMAGEARLALAELLVKTGGDKHRARRIAEAARDDFTGLGEGYEAQAKQAAALAR